MPKPKPDQIVRHELVLGRADRELIGGAVAAYQINNISEPVVEILKDASALLAIAALLEALGFTDFIPNEYLEAIREGAAGGWAAIAGMIDSFADAADDIDESLDELILEISQLPQEVQDAISGAADDLNPFPSLPDPSLILSGAALAGRAGKRRGAKLWAWLTTQANRLAPPAGSGPFGGGAF